MRFLITLLMASVLWGVAEAAQTNDLPPLPPSPVQPFREWLKMSPTQRSEALEGWPSEKREVLIKKLQVYGSLDPVERERRLRMVELRYYMQPLMTNSAAERAVRMRRIPVSLRGIVAQRLRQWDSIQAETKEKLLANEAAMNYFASLPPAPPGMEIRVNNEAEQSREHLKLWQKLSADEREKLSTQFNEFFELPRAERVRALASLSEVERAEMQSTLDAFAKLSPEQRALCIESFNKFTKMSPAERNTFLRNAARWGAMSAEERATWKNLVRELPPLPPLEMPPMPSEPAAREIARTNGPDQVHAR